MRALVQRVARASVAVERRRLAEIGPGLLVLLGVSCEDDARAADRLAEKVRTLRVFDDAGGRMNEALGDREILCISQFTLYGDTRKGRRPSWTAAAPAPVAEPLVVAFVEALRARGVPVETGKFRAHMLVESINVGPQTLLLDIN